MAALRDRLAATGELAGADALYASVLPRAVETAELLAPALVATAAERRRRRRPRLQTRVRPVRAPPGRGRRPRAGASSPPGSATLDWDADPGRPIAPGGESWTGFVDRVADTLDVLVGAGTPGQLVVVACHAGVIEASLLAKVPVAGGLDGARLQLRTQHASLTTWEVDARPVAPARLQRRRPPGDGSVRRCRRPEAVGARRRRPVQQA